MSHLMRESTLPLTLLFRGKVRDVYEVDSERLLLIASDRVSAFDVVLDAPVPHKGAVLTQLSAWWFAHLTQEFGDALPHHLITADSNTVLELLPQLASHAAMLHGRTMLCHRTEVIPVECVVRGYLAGSAWKEYAAFGTLAGERLADGLVESIALTPAVFSPATKAASGHDENIRIADVVTQLGAPMAAELEQHARALYAFGADVLARRGILLADTKFEFGVREGRVTLIDEILTPDSSRFWPADSYEPGHSQRSFDKQPLRDWLDAERRAGRWNGEAPGPALPVEIVHATSDRYLDAFHRVAGRALQDVLAPASETTGHGVTQ